MYLVIEEKRREAGRHLAARREAAARLLRMRM